MICAAIRVTAKELGVRKPCVWQAYCHARTTLAEIETCSWFANSQTHSALAQIDTQAGKDFQLFVKTQSHAVLSLLSVLNYYNYNPF